jgi:hypothetical protein
VVDVADSTNPIATFGAPIGAVVVRESDDGVALVTLNPPRQRRQAIR